MRDASSGFSDNLTAGDPSALHKRAAAQGAIIKKLELPDKLRPAKAALIRIGTLLAAQKTSIRTLLAKM